MSVHVNKKSTRPPLTFFCNLLPLSRSFRTLLCLTFFTLILQGCSHLQPQSTPAEPVTQSRPLLSNYWSLSSKVGITTPTERGSAQLNWNQKGNKYQIYLTGPLGKQLASLVSDGETAVLTESNGKTYTANSEQELVIQAIGKPLPVDQMQFWIKGLKAPFYPIEPVNADAENLEFIQNDWRIEMNGFEIIDGYKLPRKLTLTYPASENQEQIVELRVIVKEWTLPAQSSFDF